MNKYVSILLLCSGMNMYAQNPPDAEYANLSPDEQAFCDVACLNHAVQHARMLRNRNQADLIPAEIDPDHNLNVIDTRKNELMVKMNLVDQDGKILDQEKWKNLSTITGRRMNALWKKQADSVGKKPTWSIPE